MADLPATYRTVNRIPSFSGEIEYTGNDFTFTYNPVFADEAFEDEFFGYLTEIAQEQDSPTLFQVAYNCQFVPSAENPPCEEPNELVSDPVTTNYTIDAPTVERWLVDNAASIGVDPSEYTVFFINWYGRDDFVFHVYTKTDDPDPDTGANFGEANSRAMIAWGGSPAAADETPSRVWFVDLSAGPEGFANNWNITTRNAFGIEEIPQLDYRIAPIWEYGNPGETYRPLNTLSIDLGKITRYVAINLLFTPSALYRAELTPPFMPSEILLDMDLYQGDPTFDAAEFVDADLIADRLSEAQPLTSFETSVNPITEPNLIEQAQLAYVCAIVFAPCNPPSLVSSFGGDLFLFARDQYTPSSDGYTLSSPLFSIPDDLSFGLLGFADGDYTTGTQSFAFNFISPAIAAAGFGLSYTVIHEVGHHLGLSHPHDGHDSERLIDYGPGGPFHFSWLGSSSHSVMSYLANETGFGQFNRDSMNRYLVAAYLNQANDILGQLEDAEALAQVQDVVLSADAQARQALDAYQQMNYAQAAETAKAAYEAVLAAAEDTDVTLTAFRWYETFEPYSLIRPAGSGPITVMHDTRYPINDGEGMLEKMTLP